MWRGCALRAMSLTRPPSMAGRAPLGNYQSFGEHEQLVARQPDRILTVQHPLQQAREDISVVETTAAVAVVPAKDDHLDADRSTHGAGTRSPRLCRQRALQLVAVRRTMGG